MFYLKNKEGNCFKQVESVSQKKALEAVGFEEYQPKAAAPAEEKAAEPKAKALEAVGFEEYQPKAAAPAEEKAAEPKAKAAANKNAVKSK